MMLLLDLSFCTSVIVIVPLQTRIDGMDFKEMPHETDRLIGNGGMGRYARDTVSFDVVFNVKHH